jgi:hypothetical protein
MDCATADSSVVGKENAMVDSMDALSDDLKAAHLVEKMDARTVGMTAKLLAD